MACPRFKLTPLALYTSFLLSGTNAALADCINDPNTELDNPVINCSDASNELFVGIPNTRVVVEDNASVSSSNGDAIFFSSIGEVLNFGTINAGDGEGAAGVVLANEGRAHNFASGVITSNNGTGVNLDNGGELLNDGLIESKYNGVNVNEAEFVYNTGTIQSLEDIGVYASGSVQVNNDGGVISGAFRGVALDNGGEVVNQNGGTISGDIGVTAYGDVYINNDGTISGTSTGVDMAHSELYNAPAGRIEGGDTGVFAANSQMDNDGGTIIGGQDGILLLGGEVNNYGTIEGTNGGGIIITEQLGIVLNNGDITGKWDGIYADSVSVVTNNVNGTISGIEGAGVNMSASGDVNNDGVIEGNWAGVKLDNGTLSNSGMISATSGDGVLAEGDSEVLNFGTINAGDGEGAAGVVLANEGRAHNFASGVITSNNGTGVNLDNGGELLNDGLIESKYNGVNVNEAEFVYNTGTIQSLEDIGVYASGSVQVNNDGGVISGAFRGVALDNGGEVVNQNGGTISGDIGVTAYGDVYINNDGTISGTSTGVDMAHSELYNAPAGRIEGGDTGVFAANSQMDNDGGTIIGGQDGILLLGGEVNNYGTIEGTNGGGIIITEQLGIVLNNGDITGKWDGIYADSVSVVTNNVNGTISGIEGAGVNMSASGEVFNEGAIEGNWAGVKLDNSALGNFGTISADLNNGAAVQLEGNSNFVLNEGDMLASVGLLSLNKGNEITNKGNITGATNDGVVLIEGGLIFNSGTIAGGVDPGSNSGADGVTSFSLLPQENAELILDNSGSITGYRNGISASAVSSQISNEGVIKGNDGGIFVQRAESESVLTTSITNSGLIEASGNGPLEQAGVITPEQSAAISVFGEIDSVVIDNSGTIRGNANGIRSFSKIALTNTGEIKGDANGNGEGFAIYLGTKSDGASDEDILIGKYDDTIRNFGTIEGDVELGAGNDRFELNGSNAQLNGSLNGSSGKDTISLSVTADEANTFNADQVTNVEVFEKLGAGFITYAGAAEFEEMFVRQGELSLASDSVINLLVKESNINSGILTVLDGGILSGGGTINGSVLVEDGGIINPGFSPGTLTIDGDLNLSEGGILQVQVEQLADGTVLFDTYNVLGGFNITGGVVELLFDSVLGGDDVYTNLLSDLKFSDIFSFSTEELLNDFTSALTATASFFTSSDNGLSASLISFNSNDASFADVTLSKAQLPSQAGSVNVDSPKTLLLLIFAISSLLMFRSNGKRRTQMMT